MAKGFLNLNKFKHGKTIKRTSKHKAVLMRYRNVKEESPLFRHHKPRRGSSLPSK